MLNSAHKQAAPPFPTPSTDAQHFPASHTPKRTSETGTKQKLQTNPLRTTSVYLLSKIPFISRAKNNGKRKPNKRRNKKSTHTRRGQLAYLEMPANRSNPRKSYTTAPRRIRGSQRPLFPTPCALEIKSSLPQLLHENAYQKPKFFGSQKRIPLGQAPPKLPYSHPPPRTTVPWSVFPHYPATKCPYFLLVPFFFTFFPASLRPTNVPLRTHRNLHKRGGILPLFFPRSRSDVTTRP